MLLFEHVCHFMQISECTNLNFEINSVAPRVEVCQPQVPRLMSRGMLQMGRVNGTLGNPHFPGPGLTQQPWVTFCLAHIFCKPTKAFYICLKVEWKIKRDRLLLLLFCFAIPWTFCHVFASSYKSLMGRQWLTLLACPPWHSWVAMILEGPWCVNYHMAPYHTSWPAPELVWLQYIFKH